MQRVVVVAEKPSVGRDIARVLGAQSKHDGYLEGNGYVVTWAIGHLLTQQNPDEIDPRWKSWRADNLPILPQTIPLKALPKTKSQLQLLKKLLNDQDTQSVICATDAGREGELIFRRIAQEIDLKKPVQRLWISSLTDEAIKTGLANLKPSQAYDALYDSAQCRAESDWLVGMNGSRAFTIAYDTLLSVGRVQTPTLHILVKRRREIEQFVPEKYCEIEADFGDYKGLWIDAQGKSRITDESLAKTIVQAVKGTTAQVQKVERQVKRVAPPLLYDLTSLQREANKKAGLTAEQTLTAAQGLYEKHKSLTYPRTDSNCLPQDMKSPAAAVLKILGEPYKAIAAMVRDPLPAPSRVFNDAKISDHHAIIPTKKAPGNMTAHEAVLYDLVVRRFIAVFMSDYVYEAMRVETQSLSHVFLSLGNRPMEVGWKAAYGKEDQETEQPLPELTVGVARQVLSTKLLKKSTKPPAPHTEASLLLAMERAGKEIEDEDLREAMKDGGLGTPATRANIIERLISVEYAVRKGRTIGATDKGVGLIDVVPVQLSSPETTGRWEKGLADIRSGKMDPDRFMQSIRKFAAFLCEQAAARKQDSPFPEEERRSAKGKYAKRPPKQGLTGMQCPLCGGGIVAHAKGFGCANWKQSGCTFTIWSNMAQRQGGVEVTEALLRDLLAKGSVDTEAGQFSIANGKAQYTVKP